jgi:cation diffusion facilitator CzcD-associated flavoprotein CzcO
VTRSSASEPADAELDADTDVDVLIIGAGLSGIGAACHLHMRAPGASYALIEARAASGGTWDLFRYPGVRSDSDMFTLGYAFQPWKKATSFVSGQEILDYIRRTAAEFGVDEHITYLARALRAEWSSERARWTVTVEKTPTGEQSVRTCSFLYLCSGYYRYDEGHTPAWRGREAFTGDVVHPQHWPEGLDVAGKRVVVIGSGATAVTLVPALARRAAHVTMLQRSPSFVLSLPARDPVAGLLNRLLPENAAYRAVRWKNTTISSALYRFCRRHPARARALIRRGVVKRVPAGYDVGRHFTPAYEPWDQRLCLVPDGDLFAAISSGRAGVVTDHIEEFTAHGLRLRSGSTLAADVVVTATGLNLLAMGGIELAVDGERVEVPKRVVYKGMMLDGVPNLAFALGYTNAPWTLKVDLVSAYVGRLLAHMEEHGFTAVVPRLPAEPMRTTPFIEMASGYFQRSREALPLQGDRAPWRLRQHYAKDATLLRGPVAAEELVFTRPTAQGAA